MPPAEQPLDLHRLQVENSLGLLCVHDMNGVLLSVNPAVGHSLGYAVQEGIGRNLRDFLAPSVRHLFDDYLRRIQNHQIVSGLMRLVARDGTERVWFYRNTRYDRPGQPPLVLGHALDVTRRVRTERELTEAQKALRKAHDELAARVAERTRELEQTNERLRSEIGHRRQVEDELLRARQLESLGVLAGGIAHDFNNFLTVIQGSLALAKVHLPAAHAALGILDQANDACQRAASLSNQLLTFAKGGAPVRQIVSVGEILKSAVELVRAGSPTAWTLDVAEDLWPAEVDPEQIRQALHNILLNAREAVSDGGAIEVRARNRATADIGAGRTGPHIRITIEDDGPGIAPENLPKIFDPYFTTKSSGSGLGLATAYAIISRHNGQIGVESRPGVKTRFSVDLPASPAATPEDLGRDEGILTGSGRILVMDDNDTLRVLLGQMLGHLGYESESACHGAEAVTLFEQARQARRPFQAVLLDLTIPGGMGGVATAAKIRELDRSVKLIVSSGYSDAPVMSEFRRYGFDAIIPKPWSLPVLSRTLKRVLG
ncbi:MAG TPA: ATP-binding protein [Bryobacteraceae bacterium]|nr:ATP-binding protein [Bryobacteraceae bacterium]